jgi:hypothetical protein
MVISAYPMVFCWSYGLERCKSNSIQHNLLLLEVKSIAVKAEAGENIIFSETRHGYITHRAGSAGRIGNCKCKFDIHDS